MAEIGSVEELRREDGKLPTFTLLGSYPLLYLDRYNNPMCADCANDPLTEPPAVMGGVFYEGAAHNCEVCNIEIESAYGDPDEGSCEGHESLEGEHMGNTVYCNGDCR